MTGPPFSGEGETLTQPSECVGTENTIPLAAARTGRSPSPNRSPNSDLSSMKLVTANWYRTAVDLAWTDNSDNETALRISISRDGVNWDNVAVTQPIVTSVRLIDLLAGAKYYVRV